MKEEDGSDKSILWVAARVFIACALGLLLYFAHAAFAPGALALLLSLILSGLVEALHHHKVPRSLSALLILLIALCCIGVSAVPLALIWSPAQAWLGACQRPTYGGL